MSLRRGRELGWVKVKSRWQERLMTVSVPNVTCDTCLDGPYGYGLTVRQAKEMSDEQFANYMRPSWPWI